ncbi:Rasa4, partial [Symbiodinium microadriaticum]
MFVKGEEKVSTDILNISYAIGDAVSFMFFLPVDNDPSTCTMEIEVWISENRLHETEGQSANDLFLGYAELQGTDLVQLLRPKAEEKTFPLKSKTKSEVRSSVNRNVRGASITIKGRVPDLVRTLSSKKIAKGGGSSNWRNASQANLKLPSSVETIDPMLKKETFQIHLCEAGGLSKGASLMGGFSDMYAVVYWRGESLGTTEKMKSQASAIVNKDGSPTCEVVWENEVFILTKPEGERITECSLTIEIFEKKSLGGSVFLGCVNWEEDLLLEFLHVKEPSWHKLLTSYSKPMDEQRRVQGKLFIGAKCLDDQAVSGVKVGGWEFDPSVPLKDDMKDVEFSVLAASGLGKADKFGKSDPFCVVKWNGVEIGKSEVVKKSLDPVWEEANFVIRTPKNLGPLADSTLKGTSTDNVLTKRRSFVAPGGVAETIDLAPARGRDRRRVAVPISALSQNVFTSRTDCELSVEVWDWNASGNSVFLGCVELKGPELASFMDVKDMKRQSFTLTTTKKMSKNSQKLVKGSIVFLLSPMPSEKEAFMGRDIELEISAARSLQKADRFGLADPYCVVRWNHKVAGKTNVVKNSLNPLWRNEIFQIRTRGTDSLKMCLLYIEIWDQTMNGKGNFLGCFELTGQDLEQLVENNDLVWHTLKPSPYLSKAVQSLKPTGELQFRLGLSGTTGGAASNIASFELAVMCAENIAPTSFFGDVDSFCVVKSNGKEMGTTAVITKNNNPRWSGERFVVSMHTHVDPDTEETSSSTVVSIEMWSMLALGRGDFLGGVTLTYADLVRLAEDCMSTKRAAFTWHDLQKSPALPDSKQKHIQGRLRLGCKNFGSTSVEEIGLSGESEVKVLWPTPPPTVLFVDAKDNREICIGEVVIPHEFLLRPPADAFELWLTPPSKNPPKSFDFVVDGSLTITLTGGGANS